MYMENFIGLHPLIEKELPEGLSNTAVVIEKLYKEREICN